jgi:hypothetical protein
MNALEDRISDVLQRQADAMHVPIAHPGDRRTYSLDPCGQRPWGRIVMAAAAAALVAVAAVAVFSRRDEPPGAATVPPESGVAAPAAPALRFETPTVRLEAGSVNVTVAGTTFTPDASDLVVEGDPGRPNEYTTLELIWHDKGVEQRINIYFASDGVDWWASEIRTYDGSTPGGWIEPAAIGSFFRSPLGTRYSGDLDLPNLQIHDMTLEAFLPPASCDAPTAPVELIADYPTIDSLVGGFVATFQIVDTATCTYLAVAPYTFEFTSDDPLVAAIANEQQIPDDLTTKYRLGIELAAPGETVVHATARDATGVVVGTADIQVTVTPPLPGIVGSDTARPPGTAAAPAQIETSPAG